MNINRAIKKTRYPIFINVQYSSMYSYHAVTIFLYLNNVLCGLLGRVGVEPGGGSVHPV